MRLSNRARAPFFSFINSLAFFGAGLCFAAFIFERYKICVLGSESILLIIFPLICGVYIFLRGRQIFEYDSDGEALHIKNRNVTPFLGQASSDEFPKYKLIKYEFTDMLGIRKLYITISSKKSHAIILKYDVSYVNSKGIRDLKLSLNKIIKANSEAKNPMIKDND